MKRTRKMPDLARLLSPLAAFGEGAPGIAEKVQLVRSLRGQSEDIDHFIDEYLVCEVARMGAGLLETQAAQGQLRKRLQLLAAPPHHPAIFLGRHDGDAGPGAMVCHGSSRRVVTFADDVDVDAIGIGDEVLLGSELNVVIRKSPYRPQRGGETAVFDRYTEDGRILVKWRDEEVVVDAAGPLAATPLRNGDLLRWERNLWLAFEKINRARGEHLFLEETPDETFDDIGGLDEAIAELQGLIRIHLEHPDLARRYRLRRKGSVLLTGPPGTGKTLIARAMSRWMADLVPSGRSRFVNIKPGSLNSCWYGEAERNYRELFRMAREASLENPDVPVVLFFDEIDAIGSARTMSMARVDDRVLPAFLAELSSFEERGNVLVVAATNRADALDPALLRSGRLGDLIIEVPRPRRIAGRAIFEKHLRDDVPFAVQECGEDAAAAHATLIDAALSRIYAPNGGGELARLTFRDGKRRDIRADDLVSGAAIAKICGDATQHALLREIETGERGLRAEDLFRAIDQEFTRAAGMLTPLKCRKHLSGLPQDVDVVSVDPIRRTVARTHRYLQVA